MLCSVTCFSQVGRRCLAKRCANRMTWFQPVHQLRIVVHEIVLVEKAPDWKVVMLGLIVPCDDEVAASIFFAQTNTGCVALALVQFTFVAIRAAVISIRLTIFKLFSLADRDAMNLGF